MKRYFIIDYQYGSVLYQEDMHKGKIEIGKFATHDEAYEMQKELESEEED